MTVLPIPAVHLARLSCVVAALLIVSPSLAAAQDEQYRISQRATLSQKLGATKVSVDYSRPLVRGRADLFGKVIHWGELWTPGANEATVLEVDREVKLNDRAVPAGRWSMWIIPSRVGQWELILDKRDSLFHTERPELTDEQIVVPLETQKTPWSTEALTWAFPRIAQDGGTLRMNWDTLQIDIEVAVASITPVVTVAPEEAAHYVGVWTMIAEPNPARPVQPPPMPLTVSYGEDNILRASFPPGAFGGPPPRAEVRDPATMTPQERERAEARRVLAEQMGGSFAYALVPRARGIFLMGWMEDGVLLDVEKLYHEFEFEDGKPVRLVIRNDEDRVIGRGTRAGG